MFKANGRSELFPDPNLKNVRSPNEIRREYLLVLQLFPKAPPHNHKPWKNEDSKL